MSITSAGTRGWRTVAGSRPSRRRATSSRSRNSITGPHRMRRRRSPLSPIACCRSWRRDAMSSSATTMRSATTSASCRRRATRPVTSPSRWAAARTTRYSPAISCIRRCRRTIRSSRSSSTSIRTRRRKRAQLPGALLRQRHAVLHRAFPLAVGRQDQAQGQWVRLRGGLRRPFFSVMPGLVPGIHVLTIDGDEGRGWPEQARP